MKNLFGSHYAPSSTELREIWNNCFFVFDANVILNFYRYSASTRREFINILNKLQDRIWLPHQAALEYHNNRISVILEQQDVFNNIRQVFEKESALFLGAVDEKLKGYKKQRVVNISDIIQKMKDRLDTITTELSKHESDQPDLMNDDFIRTELSQLFEGKIGKAYSKDEMKTICSEGVNRFEVAKPPGYMDGKGKKGVLTYYNDLVIESMYGDLIIWKQIIDKAKELKKPIIFITDDNKEDWWQVTRGRIIGPRLELLNEFHHETETDFYMYQPDRFMEYALKYLNEQANKEAIAEVKEGTIKVSVKVEPLILDLDEMFLDHEVKQFIRTHYKNGAYIQFADIMEIVKKETDLRKGPLRVKTLEVLDNISNTSREIKRIEVDGRTRFVRYGEPGIKNLHDLPVTAMYENVATVSKAKPRPYW